MWSDVLTKPLQGRQWCVMRSNLMNCPVDYDNEAELANTHPDLLPKEDDSPVPAGDAKVLTKALALIAQGTMTRRTRESSGHRRSVLGNKLLSALGEGPKARNKSVRFAHGCKPSSLDMAGTGAKVSGGKPASQRILLEAILCLIALRRKGR